MAYTFRIFKKRSDLFKGHWLNSEDSHDIVSDYIKKNGITKELRTEIIRAMFDETEENYANGAPYCMFLEQLNLIIFKRFYTSAYIKECIENKEL